MRRWLAAGAATAFALPVALSADPGQGGRLESRPTRSEASRPARSEAKPSEDRTGLPSEGGPRHELGPADGAVFRFDPPAAGSYELPPIDRVSEHVLLGRRGQPAPLLDLRPGEAALVSFVYLSCGEECPLSTATLHRLDRSLADDTDLASRVKLVTVSFDPARDTPERMAALADRLAPKGRWQFLTSESVAAIGPVLADFGQDSMWIPGDAGAEAPGRLRHVLKVFLVDAQRDVRNVYSTGLLDERLVLNDLRTVLGTSTPSAQPSHP